MTIALAVILFWLLILFIVLKIRHNRIVELFKVIGTNQQKIAENQTEILKHIKPKEENFLIDK